MVRHVIGSFVFLALMLSVEVSSMDVESICGPETDNDLIGAIHNARRLANHWLIGRRERHFGWPKGNTAAALTSLQLANESLSSRNESSDLQATFKQLHLEILSLVSQSERSRLSNSGNPGKHHQTTIDRLPYYIMALNATCQNATDFHGVDLVSMLTANMRRFHKRKLQGSYQHALGVLAMCSTGHPVKRRYIEDLINEQEPNGCYARPCTSTCGSSESMDTTSMVLSALSCVQRTHMHHDYDFIGTAIESAVDCLLQSHQNGSFGNVVNNALAVQGLLAAEVNHSRWDCHGTMRTVLDAMHSDGHFGGLATTINILPLLAGRHHRHIKELDFECPEEYSESQVPELEPFGNCQLIRIILQVSTDDGDMFYQVDGAQGESLLDFMHREQQVSSLGFSFKTKTTDWGEYITSINGVSNDDVSGQHWIIEKMEGDEAQCIDKGAADIYPEYLDHYVWIHRTCVSGGISNEGGNNVNENTQ